MWDIGDPSLTGAGRQPKLLSQWPWPCCSSSVDKLQVSSGAFWVLQGHYSLRPSWDPCYVSSMASAGPKELVGFNFA